MLSRLLLKNHMQVHKLVIVRHGESVWSKEKKWAGWADVPLSPEGISQAKESAKQIKHAQLDFDEVYTSVLTRAIRTTNYILDELDAHYLPVQKDWRLNEKHYGSLQVGLCFM
jgi:2,3-bisphosphoglycerate-dependent phosphoglycerate mutase